VEKGNRPVPTKKFLVLHIGPVGLYIGKGMKVNTSGKASNGVDKTTRKLIFIA
jgi:hypothetical protein